MQEDDELFFPDKSVYHLKGASTKGKIDQQPFRKYTPKPPVNRPKSQPILTDNANHLCTHGVKKIVRPTISATLPSKPKSGPVQLSLGFQCPAIPVQTSDEKARINPDPVQGAVSKIRRNQNDEEETPPPPQSLREIRHPGNSKTSHGIAARTASGKRQESEEKRRTILSEVYKIVESLSPRHELIMKEGQWRPVSSAQHRKPKVPSMDESNRKGMKNGVLLVYRDRSTRLVNLTHAVPLPRRSPKTSSNLASPSPGKPCSAPAKMSPAFHWPAIQEQSGFGQAQTRSQTRRMRLHAMKSAGPDLSTNGKSRSKRTDCYVPGENYSKEVFDLTPTAGSLAPKVVNHPQKTMDFQNVTGTAGLVPTFAEGELNVPKYVHSVMNRSSPDSAGAQLIANSKELTLYDSTESPSLQER